MRSSHPWPQPAPIEPAKLLHGHGGKECGKVWKGVGYLENALCGAKNMITHSRFLAMVTGHASNVPWTYKSLRVGLYTYQPSYMPIVGVITSV